MKKLLYIIIDNLYVLDLIVLFGHMEHHNQFHHIVIEAGELLLLVYLPLNAM